MKIGIVDTTFARFDMYKIAKKAIDDSLESVKIERYTVPGVKDIPVAAKILAAKYNCGIVIALGMPGPKEIDRLCAHEASTGIIKASLETDVHIIEVFIHENEAENENDLSNIVKNRVYDHAKNALDLLKGKEALSDNAGQGIRQGKENLGEIQGWR